MLDLGVKLRSTIELQTKVDELEKILATVLKERQSHEQQTR
jgi:hypothetical protein